MDFSFNEDQLAIRQLSERVFGDLCSDAAIKDLSPREAASTMHRTLWDQLAEIGVLGLAMEEQYQGLGMGLLGLCLVLEQQGRVLAPVPLLATLVECAMTLAESDHVELQQKLLPEVAAGRCLLSSLRPYTGLQAAEQLAFTPTEDGYALNGRTGFATYITLADGYILSAEGQDGSAVVAWLGADTQGIKLTEQRAINDEPGGYLTFFDVRITAEHILARGDRAKTLLMRQKHRTWIATAALQIGILDEGLKRTAAFLSTRKQFGRPLGAFQAVSQQAADAYMEIESLRSVYWRALEAAEQHQSLALTAGVAAHWSNTAAHQVAHTFLHLHGGIGQDLDYPIHRYFLWAKYYERHLGASDELALQLGDTLIGQIDHFLKES